MDLTGAGVACTRASRYNHFFPRKLHGRILPAHFFCLAHFFLEVFDDLMNRQSAIDATVSGLGYELVDTERSARGLLRVFIDRVAGDPHGEFITVDDCEKVTRQLQHVLEVEGFAY